MPCDAISTFSNFFFYSNSISLSVDLCTVNTKQHETLSIKRKKIPVTGGACNELISLFNITSKANRSFQCLSFSVGDALVSYRDWNGMLTNAKQ